MTHNAGNATNTTTVSGVVPSGGGWVLAERPDLPFAMVPEPGEQNPRPLGEIGRSNVRSFADQRWTAEHYAWLVLHELIAANRWQSEADTVLDPMVENLTRATLSPPVDWSNVSTDVRDGELKKLRNTARDERSEAMGEIVPQDGDITIDFMALLSITPVTHPNTYRLLHIASLLAQFAVMHYKGKYNRPRPSQVSPGLLPPIPVPGHASFPSGHATQAYLTAHVLGLALGVATSENDAAILRKNLQALADRISRNREIAGLHFPSDTTAGQALAESLHTTMTQDLSSASRLGEALEAAAREWA